MAVPDWYTAICDTIADVQPELAGEARSFHLRPVNEFASFLDDHFPLPDYERWGMQPIDGLAERFSALVGSAPKRVA